MIELRDDQKEALKKMKNGCILCGEPGSGKSRTAIAYFCQLYGGDLDGPAIMKDPPDLYIITTAAVRDKMSWDKELVPFMIFTKGEKYYKHTVVIDSWNNIQKYKDIKNAFFIFDEQRVVGTGPWARAFIRIAKNNRWILLSATPGDKWLDYMSVFIANGFYSSITDFKQQHLVYEYCRAYSRNYWAVKGYMNKRKLLYLRDQILVPMKYSKNTEQHHETITVPYNKDIYKRLMKTRWNVWKDRPIENASELCQCLRKVCNTNPGRIEETDRLALKHKRVLIFYNYDYELMLLREYFDPALNPDSPFEVAQWNGHVHEPIPNSDYWIYLIQYNAGAEGWNCTETDTVIFYSQNYSYRIMKQASGRIDRANTPFKDLYYYHLKSKSPIDIGIDLALKEKRDFNESAFLRK